MTDVIFNDVAHKPARQENSDNRIYQIQVVGFRYIKIISQEILYLMDKELQYQSCKRCEDSDQET